MARALRALPSTWPFQATVSWFRGALQYVASVLTCSPRCFSTGFNVWVWHGDTFLTPRCRAVHRVLRFYAVFAGVILEIVQWHFVHGTFMLLARSTKTSQQRQVHCQEVRSRGSNAGGS